MHTEAGSVYHDQQIINFKYALHPDPCINVSHRVKIPRAFIKEHNILLKFCKIYHGGEY